MGHKHTREELLAAAIDVATSRLRRLIRPPISNPALSPCSRKRDAACSIKELSGCRELNRTDAGTPSAPSHAVSCGTIKVATPDGGPVAAAIAASSSADGNS